MDALRLSFEAHPGSTTIYLDGTLTAATLLRVLVHCRELPAASRTLRLDCRAIRGWEPLAVDALLVVLDAWRTMRGGRATVLLPDSWGAPAARRQRHAPPVRAIRRNATAAVP